MLTICERTKLPGRHPAPKDRRAMEIRDAATFASIVQRCQECNTPADLLVVAMDGLVTKLVCYKCKARISGCES